MPPVVRPRFEPPGIRQFEADFWKDLEFHPLLHYGWRMSDVDGELREIVETFVAQLKTVLRRSALATVQNALGEETPRSGRAKRAVKKSSAPRSRKKGSKRSPEELDALVKSLLAHVRKNPGQRIEQIGARPWHRHQGACPAREEANRGKEAVNQRAEGARRRTSSNELGGTSCGDPDNKQPPKLRQPNCRYFALDEKRSRTLRGRAQREPVGGGAPSSELPG